MGIIEDDMATTLLFSEDFGGGPETLKDGQVSRNGKIRDVYGGYGFVKIAPITEPKNGRDGSCLHFKPQVNDAHTSACLIRLEKELGDFDEEFYMRTVEQTKSNPENWEVGWFIWHYTDNTHHYYCALKKNKAVEVGKKDYTKIGTNQIKTPDGTVTTVDVQDKQVFLFTKENAVNFELKKWFKIRLIVKGFNFKIYVDGTLVADVTDDGKTGTWLKKPIAFKPSPQMARGYNCKYSEDAYVQVDNIKITTVPT